MITTERVFEEAKAVRDATTVYMAGPVDYVEHRSPGDHLRDNWRHRWFGDMPIQILCPTCLNVESTTDEQIMATNDEAIQDARWFIGYFPGDVATFGTPVEIDFWMSRDLPSPNACLVHPARPGVFVRTFARQGLVVVRTFEEARAWLRHQI